MVLFTVRHFAISEMRAIYHFPFPHLHSHTIQRLHMYYQKLNDVSSCIGVWEKCKLTAFINTLILQISYNIF